MSAPGNKQRVKSARDDWRTPVEFFNWVDSEFHFTLDGASSKENALCTKFYTEEDDAFKQNPIGEVIWCNPPYGGNKEKWVDLFVRWGKAGNTVVALLPSATDTKWWMKAYENSVATVLLVGRIQFEDNNGIPQKNNTTGSTLFTFCDQVDPEIFVTDWKPLVEAQKFV